MAITNVRARAVVIPMSRPTRIATRTLSERHFLLVEITTADGAVGTGYAYAGTAGGRVLAAAVEDLLWPVLRDAPEEDIYGLWDRMYRETLLSGRRGAVVRAISAVDIALWDLRATVGGVPLAVLLGGSATRPIPAYASGGYYRDDADPVTAVAEEIADNRAAGFSDHKIKVGGLPVAQDAARVRAAIEAIDGAGRLALDANNAYRSVGEALDAARAFERAAGDQRLWWLEEPLSPDDIAGHAELARVLETPVATGEIHQTRWEFGQLIEQRAADILQPDVSVLGGVSEWMRVAHAASVAGLPVAPHWHANLHAHLAAATPDTTVTVEHFALQKGIYPFESLITEQTRLAARGGALYLTDRPGIGVEFDQAALSRYQIN